MKRRILAAALTVFMLLTLLPTTVFAEDPNTVTSPQDNGSAVSTEESGNVDVPEWDPFPLTTQVSTMKKLHGRKLINCPAPRVTII